MTEFFEDKLPTTGSGLCSDPLCPCAEVVIRCGQGYLYITKESVDFRRDARSLEEAGRKWGDLCEKHGSLLIAGHGVTGPILVCEQGARKRGLDLTVASEDAKRWWQTGQVPLRPTPMAKLKSRQAEGRTVEEAKSAAFFQIPSKDIVDWTVVADVREMTAQGIGETKEEATRAATGNLPPNAFDGSPPRLVQKKTNGESEVAAHSEEEVLEEVRKIIPRESVIKELTCIIPPQKWVFGFLRKQGRWHVRWNAPFLAEVRYMLPALVSVRYYP